MTSYSRCNLCDRAISENSLWYGRNEWGIAICRKCTRSGVTEGLSPMQEQRFHAFMAAHGFKVRFERNERGFAMLPFELVAIKDEETLG